MKLLSVLIGLGLILGGGYWWWSSRPAGPLTFENTRSLQLEPREENMEEEKKNDPVKEVAKPMAPLVATTSVPESAPASSSDPTPQEDIEITPRLVSFGFRTPSSARTIDTVVLHSSYNASGGDVYNLEKIISQYEQYGVGAHYLIDRSGKIYQLVRESNIAYHVGQSKLPDGRKNGNDFSIGIELIGTEESGFTQEQYKSLNDLITDIKTRYKIKDIVGHNDISTAPERKTDPWKFDWKKLQ